MTTELTYLTRMDLLELGARVTSVTVTEGRTSLTLDRTVFYPQGGGQPSDAGAIRGTSGSLQVEEVRWSEDGPQHVGTMTGTISVGDQVELVVDGRRRALHTRLHSAGHLVDMAIDRLNLDLVPGKGYHFPQGPYVEYIGATDLEKDELSRRIESEAAAILAEDHRTEVRFIPPDELGDACRVVPQGLPTDESVRVVFYGPFGVACGGTHVQTLSEIGRVVIRKIKTKRDNVRVSYAIEPVD